MAIYKFSNAGGFANYVRYNDFLAGNPAVNLDKGSMFPLGVFTLPSAQASVTFSNIPQTYKHLQIRCLYRASGDNINSTMTVNSDSGSNYTYHYLLGDGSSASSGAATSQTTYSFLQNTKSTDTANIYAVNVIDILDYSNTNKFKTLRSLQGFDTNGAGRIALWSSLWMNTNGITSITISQSTNFAANSSFALYGVQA